MTQRPEIVIDAVVEKCAMFTERQTDLVMEEASHIKSEFSLYNTFQFLTDELTASFEMISENVSLEESDIAPRLTRSLLNNDLHEVKRPHATEVFVDAGLNSKN